MVPTSEQLAPMGPRPLAPQHLAAPSSARWTPALEGLGPSTRPMVALHRGCASATLYLKARWRPRSLRCASGTATTSSAFLDLVSTVADGLGRELAGSAIPMCSSATSLPRSTPVRPPTERPEGHLRGADRQRLRRRDVEMKLPPRSCPQRASAWLEVPSVCRRRGSGGRFLGRVRMAHRAQTWEGGPRGSGTAAYCCGWRGTSTPGLVGRSSRPCGRQARLAQ